MWTEITQESILSTPFFKYELNTITLTPCNFCYITCKINNNWGSLKAKNTKFIITKWQWYKLKPQKALFYYWLNTQCSTPYGGVIEVRKSCKKPRKKVPCRNHDINGPTTSMVLFRLENNPAYQIRAHLNRSMPRVVSKRSRRQNGRV